MDGYTPVKIDREYGSVSDSISTTDSPLTMFNVSMTLRDLGIEVAQSEYDGQAYDPKKDYIQVEPDTANDNIEKSAIEFTTKKIFAMGSPQTERPDSVHIVKFAFGSCIAVWNNHVKGSRKDKAVSDFDSFIEEQDMPTNRFPSIDALKNCVVQNEIWWREYKQKYRNEEERIIASRIAICDILTYYPSPGFSDSGSDTLHAWKRSEKDEEGRDVYVAVTKVVASRAITVCMFSMDDPHHLWDARYNAATEGRNLLRFDYLQPRIVDVWRLDIK